MIIVGGLFYYIEVVNLITLSSVVCRPSSFQNVNLLTDDPVSFTFKFN